MAKGEDKGSRPIKYKSTYGFFIDRMLELTAILMFLVVTLKNFFEALIHPVDTIKAVGEGIKNLLNAVGEGAKNLIARYSGSSNLDNDEITVPMQNNPLYRDPGQDAAEDAPARAESKGADPTQDEDAALAPKPHIQSPSAVLMLGLVAEQAIDANMDSFFEVLGGKISLDDKQSCSDDVAKMLGTGIDPNTAADFLVKTHNQPIEVDGFSVPLASDSVGKIIADEVTSLCTKLIDAKGAGVATVDINNCLKGSGNMDGLKKGLEALKAGQSSGSAPSP